MSSENIFEVLQNIAENTESSEKFLNILKENGFTGTLEEAENQINQQTQVVLNNLTTEDLQNIAGGKSLMNDKLKKALAVGGASLMAAGTVMPSGSAQVMNKVKKTVTGHANEVVDYVKKNPVHTTVTGALAIATILLSAKSAFGGKTVSGLPFEDEMRAYLRDIDLSEGHDGFKFVQQLEGNNCKFKVIVDDKGDIKIKFTAANENVLQKIFYPSSGSEPELTIVEITLKLLRVMDGATNKYVGTDDKLLDKGAEIAKILCPYVVKKLLVNAEATAATAKKNLDNANETLAKAASSDGNYQNLQNAVTTAQKEKDAADAAVENLQKLSSITTKFEIGVSVPTVKLSS